jgi:hypothetical protein
MSMALPLEAIAIESQRAHLYAMTQRATKRPAKFAKPANWTNDPAPQPEPVPPPADPLDPTRYGDWEKNGIAVDF